MDAKAGPHPWERGTVRFGATTRTGKHRVFLDYHSALVVADRHDTRPWLIGTDGRLYEIRPMILERFQERFGVPPWTCDTDQPNGDQ